MSLQTVAFIGTGIMGQPMARNLLHAGYPVRVWNRSAAKAQELSAQGAEVFDTPAQAAEGADVLICMLSDGPTCDEVLFAENGAAQALATGALVVVMSSIPVDTAVAQARLSAELGLGYLDAPVSGASAGLAKPAWRLWSAAKPPPSSKVARYWRPWAGRCTSAQRELASCRSWSIS